MFIGTDGHGYRTDGSTVDKMVCCYDNGRRCVSFKVLLYYRPVIFLKGNDLVKKVLLSLLLILVTSNLFAVNLVPQEPATSPNYWCTWYAQNYWIGRGTDLADLKSVTNSNAREELTYHALFNKQDGWAATYLPHGRSDYIFLIDHGWQTKVESERIAGGPSFFNLVADVRDFPEYSNLEPKERLKFFNEEVKALGWNSLGIWTRGNITLEQAETFVEWSKYAGIRYWKIDGGDTSEFNSYKAKQKLYPELVLEYITGAGGNINPKWNQDLDSYPSVYDIGGSKQHQMLKCLQYSDTFRTYDASPLLMSVTTLRRTHDILKQTAGDPKYRSILNVQDDCVTGIGLGVLVASKRHPNYMERTYKGKDLHHQLSGKRHMQGRINEVERFGRWSRISPAFSAGYGSYLSSENELIDRCEFTPWDTWASATYGKMVSQSAPAIMARNMPLPKVESDGEPPYVCVTTYPNGQLGIATEGRVKPDDKWFHPRAKVMVKVKDANQLIGVAGHYKELVLEFAGDLDGVERVWGQDLLADKAIEIKNEITIKTNTISIPGDLIDRIGTMAGDEGDISVPGMVLKLEGSNLPAAGEDFMPKTGRDNKNENKVKEVEGYRGTADLQKVRYGYKVGSSSGQKVVLKRLVDSLDSGKATITWKMKPADASLTRNGFFVLSAEEDLNSLVLAGAWIGSDQITLLESKGDWSGGLKKKFEPGEELHCKMELDMDARTVLLTINGVKLDIAFSESMTTVDYIGFGVKNAETLFSEPKIER